MPELKILFEDRQIIAVEKPVNIPCQPDKAGGPDVTTLLREQIESMGRKPGSVYLGLLHRLDRPVGGVMLFAKTPQASKNLSEQIRTGEWEKTYLAVVYGKPSPEAGELRHRLLKIEKLNFSKVVRPDHPAGKDAVLSYETIASSDGLSLVRIRLQTGRHHQIRVQFAAIGNPLWGDQKYASKRSHSGQQLALWANRLVFRHPVSGERMEIIAEVPAGEPWERWR